jgi:hypothetical protein
MGVHAAGEVPASTSTRSDAAVTRHTGRGWVVFAGAMLLLVATINIIYGIGAISDASFFVNDTRYIFGSLNTWGWFLTLTGVAQLLTAFGIWARSDLATWIGIGFVGANALVQLLMIPAYPFLSLTLFAIDVLIIYGLAVHGGSQDELA